MTRPLSLSTLALASLVSVSASFSQASTIHSTALGGPWSNGPTWIGGVVPSVSDDVVLDGPVSITSTKSCAALTVSLNGLLRSGSAAPCALAVTGAVSNAGTIDEGAGGGVLRLLVGGDLSNQNLWANVETILTGASAHHLTQSASARFEGKLTRDPGATGALFLDTPFAILGDLDQDSGEIVLAPACPLTLRAGALSGTVMAQGNEIRFESWSYLDGGTYDDCVLSGAATLTGAVFTTRLTVLDSLSNVGSFGPGHAQIIGDLINQGTIFNADYGLSLDLSGDLTLDGVIMNSHVTLSGTDPHHLRMGPDGNLDTDVFLPEFGTGTLVVETDARVSEGIALGEGGTLLVEPEKTITLTGGAITGGTLLTQGSVVHMEGGGFLQLSQADELDLHGSTQTVGELVVDGDLTVAGTLQNWEFAASDITVEGDARSSGHVRDNVRTLTLHLRGDVSNTGLWENHRVELDGTSNQQVEIGAGIDVPQFVLEAGFTASSYQWTRDGVPLPGGTGPSLILPGVGSGDVGLYQCEGGSGQLSREIRIGITAAADPTSAAIVSGLWPLRPNPVRLANGGDASFEFGLERSAQAELEVFDIAGRQVARMGPARYSAGAHRVGWPLDGVGPGVYLVRFRAGASSSTRKLTVLE